MPWVRQLIGNRAGQIEEMPVDAAQACRAMGTVRLVTADELVAEGLSETGLIVREVPTGLPDDYRADVVPAPGYGFDVFVRGRSDRLNDLPLPTLAAARSFCDAHVRATQAAEEQAATAAADAAKAKADADAQAAADKAQADADAAAAKAAAADAKKKGGAST